jgi:hypothetical protein
MSAQTDFLHNNGERMVFYLNIFLRHIQIELTIFRLGG